MMKTTNASGTSGFSGARRVVVLGAGAAMALGLAACSGNASSSPTLSAEAQWADSVCTSAPGVQSSLTELGQDLSFNPSAGDSALDQMKATLTEQAEQVKSSVEGLQSAVAAAPVDAQGATQLQTDLSNAQTSLQQAVQAAATAVQAAADSTTTQEFVTQSAAALLSLKAAESSAKSFASSLTTATSGASSELTAAFNEAPACQPSASPSSS